MYGDEGLGPHRRDMLLVREFELMLNSDQAGGLVPRRVLYPRRSRPPLHRAGGAAVGQAFTLGAEDKVFGSHRSHGEVIAKGLSAITSPITTFSSTPSPAGQMGRSGKSSRKRLADADFEQQAINYLLYGMTAETFGRRTGFNSWSAACTRFPAVRDLSE